MRRVLPCKEWLAGASQRAAGPGAKVGWEERVGGRSQEPRSHPAPAPGGARFLSTPRAPELRALRVLVAGPPGLGGASGFEPRVPTKNFFPSLFINRRSFAAFLPAHPACFAQFFAFSPPL